MVMLLTMLVLVLLKLVVVGVIVINDDDDDDDDDENDNDTTSENGDVHENNNVDKDMWTVPAMALSLSLFSCCAGVNLFTAEDTKWSSRVKFSESVVPEACQRNKLFNYQLQTGREPWGRRPIVG